MRLALVLASVVLAAAAQPAAAGPFGPNRSEGAPPTKKAKPAKKAKPTKAVDKADDEEAPRAAKRTAVAKPEPKAPKKIAKPIVEDDDFVDDEDEDEPIAKKPIAKAKAAQASDDEEILTKPGKKPAKKSKADPIDDEVIADSKAKPKKVKADPIDDELVGDSKAKPGKKPTIAKQAPSDDEITITIDDEPPSPAKKAKVKADPIDDSQLGVSKAKPGKAIAKKVKTAPARDEVDDDDLPAKAIAKSESPDDDEVESDDDDDAKAKTTARLDDDGESLDEIAPSVTKTAAPKTRHKTRFYFRLGMIKQSSKLGATEFSLQTDLPIDTSSLGNGDSGVEMQQANFPVAMIVGYVLPVLKRKLSLETIIGLPTKTKFKATGALANESLAPTFMGIPTGIEALGSDIGEATFAPPMLTAVYRIAELGPVTPFAGTGIMLLMARGAKITNPVLNEAGDPKLSFSPSPGLVLQGGAEMRIWKRISARLDVKYVLGMKVNAKIENIAVTPKAIPTIPSIEVGDAVMSAKITPLVVQLGIGADF